ncbi:unnamed protein product [Lactuca saligna]|uniref:Late embryogenesis abundant protein LEA-2 subgroup domain-containing protein n=1 Tax=Lactuca saligna TaxID=75948 RepID=A0AA35UXH7_LACSI|nr:unnamed protein product [Lactuca saligna]
MPNPRGPSHEPVLGSRSSMMVKTIITGLLALIVMIGVTILIIWLTIKPRTPAYFINNGSIHDYNLSKDYHLNASYNFVLKTFNPSKRMSVYYDKMELTLLFKNETIGSGVMPSWHQHKRNRTTSELDLESHNVKLSEAMSRDIEMVKSTNQVVVDLKMKGRIRSKLGIWKSRYYHMTVSCVNVVAEISKSLNGSRGNGNGVFCEACW